MPALVVDTGPLYALADEDDDWHDRALRFILEPCECRRWGFAFRDRSKISRPSRCPRCRSEDITERQFSIERQGPKQK